MKYLYLLILCSLLWSCDETPAKQDSTQKPIVEARELVVHYDSWTTDIKIENRKITYSKTEYEYDNPVSGTPSDQKDVSILNNVDLSVDQLQSLKDAIKSSGFLNLEKDAYGAPEGQRFYPYTITVQWGETKKEVTFRSNPQYEQSPKGFQELEKFIQTLADSIQEEE